MGGVQLFDYMEAPFPDHAKVAYTHLKNSIAQRRFYAMIISSMVLHNLLVTIGDTEGWEAEHYQGEYVSRPYQSLKRPFLFIIIYYLVAISCISNIPFFATYLLNYDSLET